MNAAHRTCLALALAAASAAPYAAAPGPFPDSDMDAATALSDTNSRAMRGREIVPPGVILNLKGKQRNLVWQGSYIVNTTGCIDCHTHPTYSPGGDPFQGQPERVNAEQYMSGGRQFGPFTAPNLTPDNAGRPAGQILQVMPWPAVGKMTTRDLYAIYEYLRAIPSLPDNPNPGP
jgi:hypothetical protein